MTTYTPGYDALGRCVKRTMIIGANTTTTYYVYDGEKPVLEFSSTGALASKNVYGKNIDEILMRTDYPSNLTYYYQDDHQGSVTHLTLANGIIIESYRYDAFGAPTITTASGYLPNNRFMFTGREYIKGIEVYEYRARTYHPVLGRFMSEDPKGFDAGDYNLFRYCKNDPLDHTDPMGLEDQKVPEGMNDLGVQASINSERAAKGTSGYGQAIQMAGTKLQLSKAPLQATQGVRREKEKGGQRMVAKPVLREHLESDPGTKAVGAGHHHNNLTGLPAPHERGFSDADVGQVQKGKWIFLSNQSDKGVVFRGNSKKPRLEADATSIGAAWREDSVDYGAENDVALER